MPVTEIETHLSIAKVQQFIAHITSLQHVHGEHLKNKGFRVHFQFSLSPTIAKSFCHEASHLIFQRLVN